ncbi:hypothetical protein VSS37_01660 [Candidatus Thiothrix sp. Deng01]|jgi:hypothetical protein|uniref:Uncharacterized protein n=1 Tax=Candidatus Thiothrix phosphatis TaxID=3112415 RepID=A0ABU6CS68_9GAMM|nr:hypothetical protein [Candidatus Thiothrix sp. Deng01]
MRILRFLGICLLGVALTSNAYAGKGNKPCAGKKGGVQACTADGKFLCKNGSISKSKKKCK